MARTGVTYTEIAEAATQLLGQGRNPTVEQVRLILRTGSSTTIASHLRQWKANQESTTTLSINENLPAEFVAVMKGLWERLINHSNEKVTAIENDLQKTISEINQELDKYKVRNQNWQKLYHEWVAEKNQSASDKLTLEQAIEFAHKENDSLHTKQDTLLQQLQDKQERIDELHRLHKQAQDNLEHYRESTREQRLLDQQQHEQQKQQLLAETKILNEQLAVQREKTAELHRSYILIEKNHAQTISQLQQLKMQLDETEIAKNNYLNESKHWQLQHNDLQKVVDDKSSLLVDTRTEIKLVSQQLANTRKTLITTQDQNKLISHEKWELAREKAQLEGQLKQMQMMISSSL